MDPASPELVALLAACRARPADDLPRLVLADWLDENGDPDRAEFVRVQVELSHPTADARRTAELRARQTDLLKSHFRMWLGSLTGMLLDLQFPPAAREGPKPIFPKDQPGERYNRWAFRRGLVSLRLRTHAEWLSDARIRAWLKSDLHHWLEQVDLTFSGVDDFVKADLPDELHGRIHLTLGIDALGTLHTVARQCRQLALSSNYTALRSLETDGLSGLFVEQITNAEVSHLIQLTAPCGSEADRAASHIASAPFTSLSSLDIGPISASGLRALIASPYLGNLTELNLVGSPIGDAGMSALCRSRLAETLRSVEFANTGITDVGVAALAGSPLIVYMHGPRLNLMMNRIGDAGLTALVESEHLLRFSELVLRENRDPMTGIGGIGDEGVIALAESPYSANLRFLDFWRNRITDRGAFALARSPHLNSVVDLSVKENAVTAAGAAALHERFGDAAKV